MQPPPSRVKEIAVGDPEEGKRIQWMLNHLRKGAYNQNDVYQFIAFAMPLAKRSKAQLFQDLWALWRSEQRQGGYFVEFGAGDGVNLSNTYFLETEMGWRGVLAEPNPHFVESVRRNRRCDISSKCVFSVSGQSLPFLMAQEGEFSRLAQVVPGDGHEPHRLEGATYAEVATISLEDLLIEHNAPQRIDYLSVDTEGSEFEILRNFDFDRWDIRCISVEHNRTAARDHIYDLLVGNGFRRQWPELSRIDDWYVRD